MGGDEVRVAWGPLQAFTKEVFTTVGMAPEDVAIEAGVLVWANLRGVDSHGVLRVHWCVELAGKGQMNPRPKIEVVKERLTSVLIGADHTFGPVVTTFAMRRGVEKAKAAGRGGTR